ncbi:glycosyltransferase family A protein [uncultured Pontibacter sp.]|uniref:glycosyltransferase family 2 protein n=1 Tax=uncultured Pontibacter sp. TaxID=453356 RepID=UPI0026136CE0|nr:glycosyltransferase family A protein [uncultured Pontibacter sp.]
MKVSIVMPAYNAANTIAESIESVLRQSYQNWELIIVNDCSKDNTVQIINRYIAQHDNIKLIDLEVNQGPCLARNIGIKCATGDYICFLDSDDLWHPSKLELQTSFHHQHPYKISHTNFIFFNGNGIVRRPWKNLIQLGMKKSGKLLDQLYQENVVGILTVMVKRDILLDLGGFDPEIPALEDYDLWIRIAEAGYEYGYIDKKLADYRVVNGSLSNSPSKYKRVFKKFIRKHINKHIGNPKLKGQIWGNYYRYFGTVYFKNKKYKLSILYFKKAISLHKTGFISFTTFLYMLIASFKIKFNKIG